MKFPSVLVATLIAGLIPILNYFINNTKSFGLSDAIAPTLVIVASALITIFQQWKAPEEPATTARGLGPDGAPVTTAPSFLARVLYK